MLDIPDQQPVGKDSPAYLALIKRFADRDVRMGTLYTVLDEAGNLVPYRRRSAQEEYAKDHWLLDIIVKARQLGFCQSPDTPVLTSDLEWIALDKIQVGQRIMACDESAPKVRGSGRKLRVAIVEKKFEVFEQAVEITFETGAKLIATPQHKYLSRCRSGVQPKWVRTDDLRIGDVVRAVTDVWGDSEYEDGWFAGLLDGEGSMRQKPAGGFELSVSQVSGPVLDRARAYLVSRHFVFREEVDRRRGDTSKLGNKPVHKLVIHRAGDAMRLLGKCRPSRFNRQWWEGRCLPGDGNSWVKIVSMRALPPQRMVDLQTSEKTFVAGGFVSHNSTEIAVDITDNCVFRKNFKAGIIDFTLRDAQLKLQKIKTAYFGLPAAIRAVVQIVKDNEDEVWFSNGSSVVVGTSHRGGTLQYLHISEFGKIAAEKPDIAAEIISGGLNTLAPGQRVKIESTAHGTSGAFYDMVRRAETRLKEGKPLSQLHYRLHFFAWWRDPKYRVQSSLVAIPQELIEYFASLRAKYGIHLDADQRAWYALKYADLGPDKMHEEFPSHIDECFYNSLEGTWFKRQMTKGREERRIGYPIPHDPSYVVNTFWDKGINEKNDLNSIIFHQTDGTRHRIIHYYENAGEGIEHYCAEVHKIGAKREFTFGKHYGPHDLTHRIWAAGARTSVEIAKALGIEFTEVPRIIMKEDAIEAARKMLNLTWIDDEHCARLVECLDNYRKTWNKQLAQWTNVPLHNWASNAADALMTGAVGLKPEAVETANGRSRGKNKRGSQWAQ